MTEYSIDDVRGIIGDDLTCRMLKVFQDEAALIVWFYSSKKELGNKSPYDAWTDSRREDVLKIMDRHEYGTLE